MTAAPALDRPLPDRPPLAARLATRAGEVLARRHQPGRRSFLRRAAVVGTALAVNPFDYVLRPGTAYAQVCGPSNECSQGWTAFCCTINGGANTCPPGSYIAGWWKVSSSAFCRGEDRYIVDCNRLPGSSCSCRCATGTCDRRRVCCNNFRYGQCNQQIAGTTEVVCRVVICTPPWEWDPACTTTVRTDERTRDHNAPCLNGPNPTEIAVVYQDLGLVGSPLGRPVGEELAGPDGGTWQRYEQGVITASPTFGVAVVVGPAGLAYADLGGPDSALGYVAGEPAEVGGAQVIPTERGALYLLPDGSVLAVHGPVHDEHQRRGGAAGWLGLPVTGVLDAPGGRQRVDFAAGWSLVADPATDSAGAVVRLLPVDVEVPADGWYATAGVTRWAGSTRVLSAVRVSEEVFPAGGAAVAVLAAAGDFADALAGGVLAAVRRGPVLLTDGGALDAATAEELRRLAPAEVVLVGGEAALSAQVEQAVADLGPAVTRLAGDSRFATAAAVAEAVAAAAGGTTSGGTAPGGSDGRARRVYVTSGRAFPDALAASPAAGRDGAPLLLVEPTELPDATRAALEALGPDEVVVVGGSGAVSEAVAEAIADATGAEIIRVAGDSRFDTAAEVVLARYDGPVRTVLVATGEAFADALAAGAAAANVDAPLLLVGRELLPPVSRHAIGRLEPDLVVVVGGPAAVADHVVEQLQATPTEPTTPR